MPNNNTPPLSPEMKDLPDEEMVLDEEDVVEVIDITEDSSSEDGDKDSPIENSMDEASSLEKDDAVQVFYGRTPSSYSIFCCSLSKNGELAMTGSEEDKAFLWNTTTGEIIHECNGHKDSVIYADFNYNDIYAATADMGGTIRVWQISDRTCVWDTKLDDITWMKWHDSANVLLVGLDTGEVHMLKVPEGIRKVFAQGYGDKIECGVILPDGKRVAVGYYSGTIRVIDLKSNAVLSTIHCDPTQKYAHSNTITALDCHTNNNLLISTSLDGKTILSTANNGKIISILQDLHSSECKVGTAGSANEESQTTVTLETAAFCKDPSFPVAATGTLETDLCGKIYIWDISHKVLRHEIKQEAGVTKLVWTNTSILFTAGTDGVLRCFDARAGVCLRSFFGHKAAILDLCIFKDEKKVLTVSDDATARIFDISSVR